MIGCPSGELGCQCRAAGVGQLIDVHPESKPMTLRRRKDATRRRYIEVATLAKDVAMFRKIFRRNGRQHVVKQEINVSLGRPLMLLRNGVRAEERRNEFKRRLRAK